MKLKYICLVIIVTSLCQCKNAENNKPEENIVKEKILKVKQVNSNNIKFKVSDVTKKVADTLEIFPISKIEIIINGKQYEIAKVPGEGTLIGNSEFANNNVPVAAISACSSWWAGSGDWFYVIQKENRAIVYKGWDGEGNEENKGKNWEIAKEINLN